MASRRSSRGDLLRCRGKSVGRNGETVATLRHNGAVGTVCGGGRLKVELAAGYGYGRVSDGGATLVGDDSTEMGFGLLSVIVASGTPSLRLSLGRRQGAQGTEGSGGEERLKRATAQALEYFFLGQISGLSLRK